MLGTIDTNDNIGIMSTFGVMNFESEETLKLEMQEINNSISYTIERNHSFNTNSINHDDHSMNGNDLYDSRLHNLLLNTKQKNTDDNRDSILIEKIKSPLHSKSNLLNHTDVIRKKSSDILDQNPKNSLQTSHHDDPVLLKVTTKNHVGNHHLNSANGLSKNALEKSPQNSAWNKSPTNAFQAMIPERLESKYNASQTCSPINTNAQMKNNGPSENSNHHAKQGKEDQLAKFHLSPRKNSKASNGSFSLGPTHLKSSMKKSKCILTLFLITFLAAVPIFTYFDNLFGKEKSDVSSYLKTTNVNPETLLPESPLFDGIAIICNVTSVDVPNNQFKAVFSFVPAGSYGSALSTNLNASAFSAQKKYQSLSKPVTLIIASQEINFKANQPMPVQTLTFSFEAGNVNQYPFDKFSASFLLIASSTSASADETTSTAVSMSLAITGLAQSFRIAPAILSPSSSSTLIEVSITATRSFTTKFFSIFILSSLWILSFTIFALATTLWLRDRTVEPPTIGFCAGFLFALPAIRNSQPGVPPIGCTIDVAGFFWNIVLVMVSTCLLMINYIKKRQRERKIEQHEFDKAV